MGDSNRLVGWYDATLGVTLHHLGDLPAARAALASSVDLEARLLGATHPTTNIHRAWLARAMAELGERTEALELVDEAVRNLETWPDRSLLGQAYVARAAILGTIPSPRPAIAADLQRAVTLLEAALGPSHPLTREAITSLAELPAAAP
jgi:tetratricopeptide (TPR) repeat protein